MGSCPPQRCGSPPRVWGTPVFSVSHQVVVRFTPTCVGNARPRSTRTSARTVHPHVCGERCRSYCHRSIAAGSPPRVWGTPAGGCAENGQCRFTPTCVGNAVPSAPPPPSKTVHPHVCGERGHASPNKSTTHGSPPRVWGTRVVWGAPTLHEVGSPPRVWGTRHVSEYRTEDARFTPTCVGNARRRSR